MGRSGGGHHSFSSGGGHHGGGFHGGGGFHHSSYHHHHHSYYGGSYYGGRGSGWLCSVCLIPLLFILFVAFIIVILIADGSVTVSTTLTACEETLVCPKSLNHDKIDFWNLYSTSTAYLVKSTPPVSDEVDVTSEMPNDDFLDYGSYIYKSFNLVEGSTLFWHMETRSSIYDYYFDVYLVEGKKELDNFINDHGFNYLRTDPRVYKSEFNYTVRTTDEYFLIVDAIYGDTHITNQKFIVNHKHYNVSDLTVDSSSSSYTFDTDNDNFPGYCVVVKMPCSVSNREEDIEITYDEAHTGLYYAALVISILGGVGFAAAILLCVVCTLRKSKGSSGTTYQNLAGSTPVSAPVGYQAQPAVANTTPYQQPTPAAPYQQSYPATAPAYTSVDPNAPSYVPYGTAPPAY